MFLCERVQTNRVGRRRKYKYYKWSWNRYHQLFVDLIQGELFSLINIPKFYLNSNNSRRLDSKKAAYSKRINPLAAGF